MKIRLLAFFLIAAAFFACKKKDTVFTKTINNTSAKNLTFYFYGNFNPSTYGDSVMVNAGEAKVLISYSEENSTVATSQACRIYDDSVRVVVTGGGTLNKRLQDESDWTQSTDSEGNQTCTFEVTSADIL